MMKVLITGANGFIGKNLVSILSTHCGVEIVQVTNLTEDRLFEKKLSDVDFIFHLAGLNRSADQNEFQRVNVDGTIFLLDKLKKIQRKVPIIYSSSIQAVLNNNYGKSKLDAEAALNRFHLETGSPVIIYRLGNIFGKWSSPNHNSVVATFCYNIINYIPLYIRDENAVVTLTYIDNVVKIFIETLFSGISGFSLISINEGEDITLGSLAKQLIHINDHKSMEPVEGISILLSRQLYATFQSFLPETKFSYDLAVHEDNRGVFVEVLKAKNFGQISIITIKKGKERGNHYHHTKCEKFLILSGAAKFTHQNILTQEIKVISVSEKKYEIIETIPGWSHVIKNIGNKEVIALIWASEIYDPLFPDTIPK